MYTFLSTIKMKTPQLFVWILERNVILLPFLSGKKGHIYSLSLSFLVVIVFYSGIFL